MIENNVLADKSLAFAVRIVKCYKYLMEEKKVFVMSKQLMRSGTSIGANVYEGVYAQSKPDFISKLSIALKEANETSYWITLLEKTDYLSEDISTSLKKDLDEICRIIISTIKTSKKNEQK